MSKVIYNYNDLGYYLNSSIARKDPLESVKGIDRYLLPKNSTFTKPPKIKKDQLVRWIENKWRIETIKPEEQSRPTISELKEIKILEITSDRKSYQYNDIIYKGKSYKNSQSTQNKFFNLINNSTGSIDWRLNNGRWINLDRTQILELSQLILSKESESYKEESRLFDLVEKAVDEDDLKQIKWQLLE